MGMKIGKVIGVVVFAGVVFTGCGGGGGSAPPVVPDTQITGWEPNQTVFRDGQVVISFTSTPSGAQFECALDGGEFSPCTSPYSLSISGLGEGQHTFRVRAVRGGQRDATPAEFVFVVDRTGPETELVAGPCNLVQPCFIHQAQVIFQFRSPEQGATFRCEHNGQEVTPCESPLTMGNLTEGEHTFRVWARDGLGNEDATPAEFVFVVDQTPPGAPTVSLTPADRRLLLQWSGSTDANGVAGYNVYISGQAGIDPATCNCRWNASLLPAPPSFPVRVRNLENGKLYYVVVTAVDVAGNESGGSEERAERPGRYGVISTEDEREPAVRFGEDRFLVVFQRSAGTGWEVWGQWVSRDGIPQGEMFPIAQDGGRNFLRPSVAYPGVWGRFVVAFESVDGSGNSGIYAVAVKKDGPPYVEGGMIEVSVGLNASSRVRMGSSEDRVIAVWVDGGRIYSSVLTGPALSASPPWQLVSGPGTSSQPVVSVNSFTRTALMVYEQAGVTGTDIYGLALDSDGRGVGGSFLVADFEESAGAPSISPSPYGFLVAFHRISGVNYDIYARLVPPDGSPPVEPVFPISTYPSTKILTSVAYHPQTEKFLVAWMDTRNVADSGFDIFGAMWNPAGGVLGEFVITSERGEQHMPRAGTAVDEILVAYRDRSRTMTGDYDIGLSLVDPEFVP